MLILAREENEVIRIGDDISIMILSVRGGRVQLGITAPAEVPVHRQEIYDRITRTAGGASTGNVKRGKKNAEKR